MAPDAEAPPVFPDGFFARADEAPDAAFYAQPRFVAHIDAATIAALSEVYRELLPADGRILDLMSSWISHLPEERRYARVEGHGMNAEELARNPRLDAWQVCDLNALPSLPWQDAAFDAVCCAVSVQYLTRPVEVFAEVARVLAPGGRVVISTSHRMFPTKAIRAWHALPPAERLRAIAAYLDRAGGFEPARTLDRSPPGADPLWIVTARRAD